MKLSAKTQIDIAYKKYYNIFNFNMFHIGHLVRGSRGLVPFFPELKKIKNF